MTIIDDQGTAAGRRGGFVVVAKRALPAFAKPAVASLLRGYGMATGGFRPLPHFLIIGGKRAAPPHSSAPRSSIRVWRRCSLPR